MKEFNKDYLWKGNTTIVNGFFIIIVFFSHLRWYLVSENNLELLNLILDCFWQLMVTTFLFFSGFGIYESVKKYKDEYINTFFKKRFLKTYINRSVAIILFLIVNILLNNELSFYQTFLAFTWWESIWNSNWYMFDIFILYIIFILSFKFNSNKRNSLYVFVIYTILFCIFLMIYKESRWYDTLFCFPLWMLYSKYKNRIDNYLMKNNRRYLFVFIFFIIAFISSYVLFYYINKNMNIDVLFNIVSFLFIINICLLLMKFSLKCRVLKWLWENLFWIYILQRIPMIIFQSYFTNIFIYLTICAISTILLTLIIKTITQKTLNKIFN